MEYVNFRSFVNKFMNRLEMKVGRSVFYSRPVHLIIEPTLRCNIRCPICNKVAVRKHEEKNSDFLSWSTLRRVSPFLKWTEHVCFAGFGEPLLHPEYSAMLRYIKSHGPSVFLYTNGILLTPDTSRSLIEAGVDLISVSFGGAKPETYRKIRASEMGPIMENLRSYAICEENIRNRSFE